MEVFINYFLIMRIDQNTKIIIPHFFQFSVGYCSSDKDGSLGIICWYILSFGTNGKPGRCKRLRVEVIAAV